MARESYQESLSDLRGDVLAMGELVLERLEVAVGGIGTGEVPSFGIAAGDEEINDRYLDLERRCIDLIALQKPVAGDLRTVVASFKIITDLERVGDLAVNLVQYARSGHRPGELDVDFRDIGRDAVVLLERSLEAYASEDAAACREIARRDDEIDALCQRASDTVTRGLIEDETKTDPWAVERLLDDVSRILLTIRDLERIADHAVNIAARTLYMVENDPELIY
ncbi:phosphate signaling complex protein PhoU [Halobellus ordinarius]|uniref:phosphate signaling complex protein PhoU n=1 Tax=Halobellus ordinarius TaxID=3075120 RepID=UPI0028807FBB|nr:phosphate signaling complex protein PhoU [Halobellus sp. ZY16]